MNHHTKEYLLANIQIIEWHLNTNTGLQCSYELDGKTFYLMAAPYELTTILSNVYLINDRRIERDCLEVHFNGFWMPFSWYVPLSKFDTIDLVLICAEHEELKVIQELKESVFLSRLKPLCYN